MARPSPPEPPTSAATAPYPPGAAGPALGPGAVAIYALGSFGTGAFSTVPTVLLLYFCTETLRIAPVVAALIVFAPKAWSLAWDPLVGAWSDRTTGRWGRRRPFLLVGALGVGAAFVAVFSPPAGMSGGAPLAVWTGVAYLALATLFSVFAVPYAALPAEIAPDAQDRSRLISNRMVLVMLGVLAGASVAPLLVQAGGGGRAGYRLMALGLGLACTLAMLSPLAMARPHDPPRSRPLEAAPPAGLARTLGSGWADRRFRWLAVSFLLQLTAVGTVSASAPYVVTRVLGRGEGDIGAALGLYVLATIAATPVWGVLGRRFGELRMLALGVVLYGVAAVMLGAAASLRLPWAAMLAAFALAGVPFAALQVLPFVAVAHLVRDKAGRGEVAEGALTGLWTATEKMGLALGPALTGLVLAGSGSDLAGRAVSLLWFGAPILCAAAVVVLRLPDRSSDGVRP